jgi:hypothetical protein
MQVKNSCNIGYIYKLIDPRDNYVRYIGQTINPQRRLLEHLRNSTSHTDYKNRWLQSLKRQNLKPIFEPFLCVAEELLNEEELFWIKEYQKISGPKLTNFIRWEEEYSQNQLKQSLIDQRGFLGISLNKKYNIWEVYFKLNNKRHYIGAVDSKTLALKIYDSLSRKYFVDPITNFEGIGEISIEQAKKLCKRVQRIKKYGSGVPGVRREKETGKWVVCVDKIHVSTYEDKTLAEKARDSFAKFIGKPTYKYHSVEAKSAETLKIENPTKGTKYIKKSKNFTNKTKREYYLKEKGSFGLTYNKKKDNYTVQLYLNGERHYLGTFKNKEKAQETYDKVVSEELTVNEAKYQALMDSNNGQRPGIIKRENLNFNSYIVSISGVKELGGRKFLPAIEIYEQAVELSIAVRNYYNLPTDKSITVEKLSYEQAVERALNCREEDRHYRNN